MTLTAAAVARLPARGRPPPARSSRAAGDDPAAIPLERVTTDAAAGTRRRRLVGARRRGRGLSRRPAGVPIGGAGGAAAAAGAHADPSPHAAALPPSGTAIAVCANPRLAMAAVIERFFGALTADREPELTEPGAGRTHRRGRGLGAGTRTSAAT